MAAIAILDEHRTEVLVARALVESAGRVLLLRRAAWDTMPGRWELPGGKVDPDEPLLDALVREVEEETGLMLDASPRYSNTRCFRSPSGRPVRETVFETSGFGSVELSDEHDAYAWVDATDSLWLTDAAAAALAARDGSALALAA